MIVLIEPIEAIPEGYIVLSEDKQSQFVARGWYDQAPTSPMWCQHRWRVPTWEVAVPTALVGPLGTILAPIDGAQPVMYWSCTAVM